MRVGTAVASGAQAGKVKVRGLRAARAMGPAHQVNRLVRGRAHGIGATAHALAAQVGAVAAQLAAAVGQGLRHQHQVPPLTQ